MFATNMDSARDVGGAPSTVLVPMRFVWPYGGRSVFLSGSFARWDSEFLVPNIITIWNLISCDLLGFFYLVKLSHLFLSVSKWDVLQQVVWTYSYDTGWGLPHSVSGYLQRNAWIPPGKFFRFELKHLSFCCCMKWCAFTFEAKMSNSVNTDIFKSTRCGSWSEFWAIGMQMYTWIDRISISIWHNFRMEYFLFFCRHSYIKWITILGFYGLEWLNAWNFTKPNGCLSFDCRMLVLGCSTFTLVRLLNYFH